MFLLTPTGSLGYKGTDAFLNELPESFMQNVVFALCLDSIGAGESLNLHISRFPRENEETSNNFFNALNATARHMNVPYKITKKPINQTSEYVPWEHERFAYKKIHGVTFSGKENASIDMIDKTSIYDNKLDESVLRRNIEVVANALTKVVFDLLDDNHSVFTGDYKVLEGGQISQLIKYFNANPRFPTKLIKGSNTLKEMTKIFNRLMPNLTTQAFEYKGVEFGINTPATMKVTKSKTRLLDMFLFLVIAIYLATLYIYMTVSIFINYRD